MGRGSMQQAHHRNKGTEVRKGKFVSGMAICAMQEMHRKVKEIGGDEARKLGGPNWWSAKQCGLY